MISPKEHNPLDVVDTYTTLDIETARSGNVLAIGLAWWEGNTRKYDVFHAWADLVEFVVVKGKKSLPQLRTIYAHNGANFDWLSLLDDDRSFDLIQKKRMKVIMSGSKAIGINIKLVGNWGTIRLRDSLRLLPASLKKLTATMAPEHGKIEIEQHPEDLYHENQELFYDYLMHDCFALQDILTTFHRMMNEKIGVVEKLPMTLASLALTEWKDYYLEQPMWTPWNKDQIAFEQQAYAGGRVEVFRYGEFDNVNVYDVNSEYPAVMLESVFPISYRGHWTRKYLPGKLAIYEVEFEQTNTEKPAVLMVEGRGAYSGKGHYCSVELEKMVEVGGKFTVKNGYVYLETGNPFKIFIEKMYALRREAQENNDEALSYTAKILMNSLYGKFGQKNKGEAIEFASGEKRRELLANGRTFTDYGDYITFDEERIVEHQFFGLAAFITAYARLKLYSYIEKVKVVLYCDTDSVHTTDEIPDEFLGNALGMMKLEYTGKAAYAGKKLYALEKKVKAKGVTIGGNNGDGGINYDTIRELATDAAATYAATFSSPPTAKEVLLSGKKAAVWYKRHRTIRQT